MAERIVTKGIVLRETQTKETDKILTVLTAEQGKLPVIARGARRKGSRIAARVVSARRGVHHRAV